MRLQRHVAAFCIAPATPIIFFLAPGLILGASLESATTMALAVGVVTYGHASIFGIPTAVFLIRNSNLTRRSVLVAAFLIGSVPMALFTIYIEMNSGTGSATVNGVPQRIDGQLTGAGLMSLITNIAFCGGLGLLTGLVWWLIVGPNKTMAQTNGT